MLRHAVLEDVPAVYAAFYAYSHIFPFVREDKVRRMITGDSTWMREPAVIYDRGVVITYQTYRTTVRLGTYRAVRGTTSLHQIVKTRDSARGAASEVFRLFLSHYVPTRLVLSVRADNTSAWQFYERHGLQRVGTVCWQLQGHPLPGYVYEWIRAVDNPLF
jgi:RimJ/RimL family protein N-acetyltransferase